MIFFMRRGEDEFIALWRMRMFTEKAERYCPAHPHSHLRRRSGRSPALPYPPRRYVKL